MAGKLVFDGAKATISGNGGSAFYTPPVPAESVGLVGYWVVDSMEYGAYWADTSKNTTVGNPASQLPDARWPILMVSQLCALFPGGYQFSACMRLVCLSVTVLVQAWGAFDCRSILTA
jgi:hypothetical protein